MRRIEVTTRLVNQEKYVRYQVLFPTTIKEGKSTHEIPFGSIDRPAAIEFPAQNWVDYGDGRRGLALLNIGLPGNLVTDGTMMVSLLRAHTLGAYGFGGGYEPGMSSEIGLSAGPGADDAVCPGPARGRLARGGRLPRRLEFNHPLICRNVLPHAGSLPEALGAARCLESQRRRLVAETDRDGDVALRVYEASGRPAAGVTIKLRAKVRSAREANLMEDAGADVKTEGNSVRFDLPPFEIKTIRLRLDPLP